ncbi:MAG: chaperone NapD [Halieaceae bacterium]|jgi:periplasmic nitrate reductase NapD|nr:chaperone NapD [Halieaceae bacterium]
MNISGLVVRTLPASLMAVNRALGDLPGVEVHGQSNIGNLVVTVEQQGREAINQTLAAIENTKDVLATSLVYHEELED